MKIAREDGLAYINGWFFFSFVYLFCSTSPYDNQWDIRSRVILFTIDIEQVTICMFRYDHPHILAGQGTCGLEIAEQVENIDAVVIPVGGAGLIAGCAVALKALQPNLKIIVSFWVSSVIP